MTVDNLLLCTKPVYREQPGDDSTAYSFLGSSFVVEFHNIPFLVTAGHVVDGIEPEDARIWPEGTTPLSLPFPKLHRPKSREDYGDMAMFEIETSLLPNASLTRLRPLQLD